MADETGDRRYSLLLSESAKRVDAHVKRVGDILEETRKKFEKDYTGTAAAVGVMVLGTSLALAYFIANPTVPTVGILVGGVVLISSIFQRHQSSKSQLEYVQTMVDIEWERTKLSQRGAMLEHLWLNGIPEGFSSAEIGVLLGDASPRIQSSDHRTKCLPSRLPDKNGANASA